MTLPRPTVFISYASEDRTAARLLRDALEAAGLDVWYDENELGGGDSWDQKIRRQIRDCDYFMPVISATTERRKEGYFRREWRLAAERTLDMADDVMFLLPVTIDGTSEAGARVPEKFVTVQWLRVPGGSPNPALDTLARRIATGDHSVPPPLARPAPIERLRSTPPVIPAQTASAVPAHDGPPVMPPFPNKASKENMGHGLKYLAEVIWWIITAGWLLLKRAPKKVRILVYVLFCIWVFSQCSRNRVEINPPEPSKPTSKSDKAEARRAMQAASEKLAQAAKDNGKDSATGAFAELGSKLAKNIADEIKDSDITDKQIVAVPFALGVTDGEDAKFLGAVFTPLYGRLAVERAGETGVTAKPLPALSDKELAALGHRLDAGFVLGAWLNRDAGPAVLTVHLIKIEDASVAWSAQYPVAGSDPAALAEQIASGVLTAAPKG